jgi:hypothetical protein
MDIGEPVRIIIVEPVENPVPPKEKPVPKQPVKEPEKVPAP